MLHRFLILAGIADRDLKAERAGSAAYKMQTAFEKGAVRVLVDRDTPYVCLPDERGVVIGSIFSREGSDIRAASELMLPFSASSEDYAKHLAHKIWGAWCAVVVSGNGDNWLIARDPSVGLPCYYIRSDDGVIISSSVRILVSAAAISPRLDWDYLHGHLANSNLRPARTGVEGVTELLAGHSLRYHARGRLSLAQIWSPWEFAGRSRQIVRRRQAEDLLRDTAIACVKAWARGQAHILLGASGGLDSSIVAACLQEAGANFSLLTMATREASGDERVFARYLSQALDCALFERFEDCADVDLTQSSASHLPRPIARSFAQSADRQYEELANELGSTAYMTGGGGDNVFCLIHSAAPIADRILVGQLGGALKTTGDVARLTKVGLWAALSAGAKKALSKDRAYRLKGSQLFLAGEDRFSECHAHPWMDQPDDVLPGKAMHVSWLLGIENHLEGYRRERTRPIISPLMSQPIVELCLQIPTWAWCSGGVDRAVARLAFTDMLPASILDRRSKGTPTSFAYDLFDANISTIRKFLLDGMLASHGVIDTAALELWFKERALRHDAQHLRVMALVDVEAWARSWRQDFSTMEH